MKLHPKHFYFKNDVTFTKIIPCLLALRKVSFRRRPLIQECVGAVCNRAEKHDLSKGFGIHTFFRDNRGLEN